MRSIGGEGRQGRSVPAESTLHFRHIPPYTTARSQRAQAVEQSGQRKQIGWAEQRPAGRHDYEGIGPFHVGPARRERADTLVSGLAEEHPVLTPGVSEADQLVLLALQRVERMGNTEPLRITAASSS